MLQGKAAEALKYLADAVAEAPNEPLYHDYYGKALWQTGARDEALREYDTAIALNPAAVEYRRDRARAYVALNRRPTRRATTRGRSRSSRTTSSRCRGSPG